MSAQPDGAAPTPPGPGSQSLQATVAKANEEVRKRSPFVFLLIGLCFFLPFATVSCMGQDLATMSGIDLVTGAEAEIAPELTAQVNEELGFEGRGPQRTEPVDPSLWAITTLAAAVTGAVVGLVTRGRTRTIASLAAALVGLAGLIGLRFDLRVEIEGARDIEIRYRTGYWIAALLFVVLTKAHGMSLRPGRKPGGASTEPGPAP